MLGEPSVRARRGRRTLAALHLLLGMLLTAGIVTIWLGGVVRADEPSAAQAIAYPLRHVPVQEAFGQLRRLLESSHPTAQIAVDPQHNRLWVTGPPEVHALVAPFVKAIDKQVDPQPASDAGEAARGALRTYPIAPERLTEAAEAVRRMFPDVQALADVRTNQLLVVAPEPVHAQISRHLASSSFPPSAVADSAASPSASTLDSSSGQHRLQLTHVQSTELVGTLSEYLRGELAIHSKDNGRRTVLELPGQDARPVEVEIDLANGRVDLQGPPGSVYAWANVIRALDKPRTTTRYTTRLRRLDQEFRPTLGRVMTLLGAGDAGDGVAVVRAPEASRDTHPLLALLGPQQRETQAASPTGNADAAAGQGTANQPARIQATRAQGTIVQEAADPTGTQTGEAAAESPLQTDGDQEAAADEGGLVGDVQIEYLEGTDVIVIRGHERDVARLAEIIEEIQRLSQENIPDVQIVPLQHVASQAMANLLNRLNEQIYASRQGLVSITSLDKPNALLFIGTPEAIGVFRDLVTRLDVPVDPDTQFQVFRLRHITAVEAEQMLEESFGGGEAPSAAAPTPQAPDSPGGPASSSPTAQGAAPGLAPRVRITADPRSNSLIVRASPRDLAEVQRLIAEIDVETSAMERHVELFPLRNSRAEDLAPILQQALSGEAAQQGGAEPLPGQLGGTVPIPGTSVGGRDRRPASAMLQMSIVGSDGERTVLRSGIMSGVQIAADPTTNTLIVTAPPEAMGLIRALIERLDQLSSAEAQIKVFTLENGDATSMRDLLEELFPPPQAQGDLFGGPTITPPQGEGARVPVRFAVDQRTNSIIASGSAADLTVVRAIILNLDGSDVRERRNIVYRLRYAHAGRVALAIQDFLRAEQQRVEQQIRAFTQSPQGIVGPFEQIEREVVVVAEELTNTLIISSTPRFVDQIMRIVQDIDAVPPMVMIQVLIAEIELDDRAEFGVELGIQDSLLFDRGSVLGDFVEPINIASGDSFAGQALTDFSLGRVNPELQYGGLVLAAGNESINLLLRALQQERQVTILSRPQIMTLDNQPARIQVGANVRVASGTNTTQFGGVNLNTEEESIGLILDVIPRVSPDGTVFLLLRAEKSALGPEATGTPIAITEDGDIVRSPRINITLAETSIVVGDGQTAVFSGLLTEESSTFSRSVPGLSNIPLLGDFFRYDGIAQRRTELLIILTPHVIGSREDLAEITQIEAARMSWCIADVIRLHGDYRLVDEHHLLLEPGVPTIYPDGTPLEPVPSEPSLTLPPASEYGGNDVQPPSAASHAAQAALETSASTTVRAAQATLETSQKSASATESTVQPPRDAKLPWWKPAWFGRRSDVNRLPDATPATPSGPNGASRKSESTRAPAAQPARPQSKSEPQSETPTQPPRWKFWKRR